MLGWFLGNCVFVYAKVSESIRLNWQFTATVLYVLGKKILDVEVNQISRSFRLLNFDVFISFRRLPKRKRLEVPNGIVITFFINSQLHVFLYKIYLYEINNGKVQQTFPFIVC